MGTRVLFNPIICTIQAELAIHEGQIVKGIHPFKRVVTVIALSIF